MAKKNTLAAYLHSPSRNPVQEASPIERKEKGTLMTFPMAKKTNLNLPGRNSGTGRCLLKKRSKRSISKTP
jgi:hypothetical protein